MRVVNEKMETITEYDLNAGKLVSILGIKEDVTPIDNVTKFAYYDDDYEEVQMYVPFTEEDLNPPSPEDDILTPLKDRIKSLEEELAAAKILLGVE